MPNWSWTGNREDTGVEGGEERGEESLISKNINVKYFGIRRFDIFFFFHKAHNVAQQKGI